MMLARLFAFLIVLLPAIAAAQESVPVRGGAHPDFGRLVFDWTSPVGYGARIENGRLIVTFDRRADFDTSSAERHLFRYLDTIEVADDGRSLVFDLKQAYGLETFTLDTKVVVDLLQDSSRISGRPAPQPATAAASETPPQPQAQALPEIRVRVGEHSEFERLVFDWPSPVGYRVEQDVGAGSIVFESAARLDVRRLQEKPPSLLRRFEDRRADGELSVFLQYVPGTRLRAFADGPRVVVDLLRPAEDAEQLAAPQTQAAADAGEPTPVQPDASDRESEGEAALGAPKPLVPYAQSAAPPAESVAALSSDEAQEVDQASDQDVASDGGASPSPSDRPAELLGGAGPEGASSTGEAAGDVPFVAREILPDLEERPAPGTRASQTPPVLLRFDWPDSVGAVALRRGAALLLGFDGIAPVDLVAEVTELAPELGAVRSEPVEGGSLLRFDEADLYAARLWRDGEGWLVEFHRAGAEAIGSPPLIVEQQDGSSSLRIAVDRPRTLLSLSDPSSGDRLLLVPLTREGEAFFEGRQTPAFDLLPTYQGIAVLPRLEPLDLALADDGVVISSSVSAVTSDGLQADLSEGAEAVLSQPRLFDLPTWRAGGPEDFNEQRQELQRNVVRAEGNDLGLARLDLARFYFAHGLASETLGVLTLIQRENPDLRADPQLMLMEAASRLMTGDHAGALELLADPALLDEAEADLWRAALAAEAQDWPAAGGLFAQTHPLIQDYARPVRVRLGLAAAEAALEAGDIGAAALRLEELKESLVTDLERARYEFLQALLLAAEGDGGQADEILERLAGSGLGAPTVQARLALIDRALAAGELPAAEAIERLEQLRFAWRGDSFEFALLQRLTGLYEREGRWREALRALRQAATYFPGTPRAEAAAEQLRTLFARVFLGPERPDLPPLTALSLYEEFRELTPAGDRGNRLIEELADRLVEVDLLPRASELLEDQVQFRLAGEDKARVGARLALIRLLNRQPREALDALEMSSQPGLSDDLVRQRRHLQARALSDLDRAGQGLALLQGDESLDALRLRAEILWAQRDWAAAAVALNATLPEPDAAPSDAPLDPAVSGQVLNLAVAYTLAGDQARLTELRSVWGQTMATGPHSEAFALLAEELDPDSVATIAQQLAQVDRVQAFMASYRERLSEAQLSDLN